MRQHYESMLTNEIIAVHCKKISYDGVLENNTLYYK